MTDFNKLVNLFGQAEEQLKKMQAEHEESAAVYQKQFDAEIAKGDFKAALTVFVELLLNLSYSIAMHDVLELCIGGERLPKIQALYRQAERNRVRLEDLRHQIEQGAVPGVAAVGYSRRRVPA